MNQYTIEERMLEFKAGNFSDDWGERHEDYIRDKRYEEHWQARCAIQNLFMSFIRLRLI